MRAFGVNTLRGRFLYTVSLLLVLLVVMAWAGGNRVREVSSDNAASLADRHRVYALTRNMSNAMWEAVHTLCNLRGAAIVQSHEPMNERQEKRGGDMDSSGKTLRKQT